MDSLLANYAFSSDEEKEVKQPKQHKTSSSASSSLFSSLPPPSSTSTSLQRNRGGVKEALRPSSFSSLPPPSSSRPKRVVEFRPPPIDQSTFQDDEEADREQKRRKESHSNSSIGPPSVKSFLSTIPAPKNSFSSLGGGRRSAIDTQTPTSAAPEESKVETHPTSNSGHLESEAASYAGYESGVAHDDALNTQPPTYSGSEAYGAENHSTSNYGDFDPNAASYVNYETGYDQNPGQHVDAGYGSYEGYGHQNSNSWGGGSMAAAIPHSESALRILGKRSKIPAEIVEVKQDELMKNRPREDQSKMTGIAFGPSYQPVSSKGKPTKLHKRKHQIGSLFFDMKQKETELAERRSKGFLTKAETHAKYGW